jgi:hypothetical protein
MHEKRRPGDRVGRRDARVVGSEDPKSVGGEGRIFRAAAPTILARRRAFKGQGLEFTQC